MAYEEKDSSFIRIVRICKDYAPKIGVGIVVFIIKKLAGIFSENLDKDRDRDFDPVEKALDRALRRSKRENLDFLDDSLRDVLDDYTNNRNN